MAEPLKTMEMNDTVIESADMTARDMVHFRHISDRLSTRLPRSYWVLNDKIVYRVILYVHQVY